MDISTSEFLKTMRKTPLGNNTSLTMGEASLLANVGIDVNSQGEVANEIEQEKSSTSFWDNIFGTIDDIANAFGRGFVGMFEGLVDFGAGIVGNIIDATGGDSSGVRDFIEIDMASNLANFTETFANFTPWGLVKENINFWSTGGFGGDYWNDAMEAWSSLGLGIWSADGQISDKDFADWQEKYSWSHEWLENETGWFGEVALGVAEGAGQLVAEILTTKGIGAIAGAIGGSAGASTAAIKTATKVGSLAALGTSAAGGGTEQALKKGANMQQASMYGLLSGLTEVGTELIGGITADVDSGLVGKIMRKTKGGNKILNNFFGNMIMNGISEGFEEVLSDVADPLWRKLTYEPNIDLGQEYTSKEFFNGMLMSFTVGSIVGAIGSAPRAYRATKFKVNGKQAGAVGFQAMQEYDSVNSEFKDKAKVVFEQVKAIEDAGHTFAEGIDTRAAIDEALNAEDVDQKIKDRLQKALDKANKAGVKLDNQTKKFDSTMTELGITETDLLEQYGSNIKEDINALKKSLGIDIISDTETFIDADENVHIATEEVTNDVDGMTQQEELTMEQAEPEARMAEAVIHNKEDLRSFAEKFVTKEMTDAWTERARQSMLEGTQAEKFVRMNAANQVIKEITNGDKYYTTKNGMQDLASILSEASSIEEAIEMINDNYEAKTSDRVNAGNKDLIKEKEVKIPGRHRWSSGVESIFNKVLDSQYALRNTLKQLGMSEAQAQQVIGKAVSSTGVGVNKALNGYYHVEGGEIIEDSVGIYSNNENGVVNQIQQFAKENKLDFQETLAKVQEALALEHEIDRVKQGKDVFGKYVNSTWVNKNTLSKMQRYMPEFYEMFSRMQTYSQADINNVIDSYESIDENQKKIIDEITSHYENMSEEEVNRKVEQIKKDIPIYDKITEELRNFQDQILKQRVSSGMMTQEMADEWKELYPHYVPTFRVVIGSGSAQSYARILSTDLKAAKGSNLVIQDIFSSIIRQSQFVNHFDSVNGVLNELYERAKDYQSKTGLYHENVQIISEAEEVKGAYSTEEVIELSRPQISGNTVYLYKNGQVITMQVSDTLLESLTTLDKGFKRNYSKLGIIKMTEKGVQTIRHLMTDWNPFFSWWRNPLKDIQSAVLYTKNGTATLLRNWGRAFNAVFGDAINKGKNTNIGKLYNIYVQEGGQVANITSLNIYDDISYNENSFKKNLRKMSTTISNFNEVMENTTRFAEFLSTYERLSKQTGISENAKIQEALNDAREITINFARKGTVTQVINKFVPFLTANIEGAARNIRAFISPRSKKELVALIIKMLILGIVPQAIQELVYSDDEDYQSLTDTMKSNYFLFKVGDEFIRIPKGYIQQAFSSGVLAATKASKGEEVDIGAMLENQWNAVGVDVSGVFFQPIIDAKNNKTWYGGEIVSQKWDLTRPSEQYDRNTSAIAKWLGKITGLSPLKIDYVLDQMTGVVGDILLPATSENGYNPLKFIKDQFVTDSVYKNKYSSEFHEYKTEVGYNKTDGDAIASVVYSFLTKATNKVSDLKDKQVELEETELSEEEKSAQDKIIQATINATYKAAIEDAKKLAKELEKYELSEESLESDRLEAYRQVLGAEFALQSYNSKVYSKAQCYYKAGISYDDFYVYYFSMKALPDRASVERYIIKQRVGANIKNLLYALMGYNIGEEKKKVLRFYLKRKGLTDEEIDIIL